MALFFINTAESANSLKIFINLTNLIKNKRSQPPVSEPSLQRKGVIGGWSPLSSPLRGFVIPSANN